MVYIYHLVPNQMKGQTLYPLNILRKKYPQIYKEKAKKYSGREHIMRLKIPIINCLWTDVLHFTPIHPSKITKALHEAGLNRPKSKWFKINVAMLDSSKTVIYFYKYYEKGGYNNAKNFIKFNSSQIPRLNKISKETREYFSQCARKNERPFLFHRLPHVLYKGSLNIENSPIIEV